MLPLLERAELMGGEANPSPVVHVREEAPEAVFVGWAIRGWAQRRHRLPTRSVLRETMIDAWCAHAHAKGMC